ncbi:SARP family transcriptional regulator [Mangrovihabitans endophyticus]|uniref:SARP family transcriptional regulator n=1 Tax=Mangrovihabitans endophyticus TaxID=1751298 RepID=A0A8J3FL05_9ACTN|nr:SARP family transcriptional regulator [Mangrovihabitans endophyticus]
MLAYLILNANLTISADQLVSALWGGSAPDTARKQVHVLISRLRQVLRDGGARESLVSRSGGYTLTLGSDDTVDTVEFERLTAAARDEVVEGRRAAGCDLYRQALALWRGPALCGCTAAFVDAARSRLQEQRLIAQEETIEAELTLGRYTGVVGELYVMREEHPLRERPVNLLMRALHRCGRRPEAAAVFRSFDTLLRDEHGLDVSADLAELHHAMLRSGPVTAAQTHVSTLQVPALLSAVPTPLAWRAMSDGAAPAQLPADVAGFTGRAEDIQLLESLLPEGGGPAATVVVAAITGGAGTGKTALAVHWAHRVRCRFPDGQLYVNLRGYSPGPSLRPIEVLTRFLHALGVPPDHVPPFVDEAATMYRGRLADRRMLIVLDNADHPGQVRPLLPGGNGSMVLVTSRDQLGGLVAREGAHRLVLGPLPPSASHELLIRVLGAERAAVEPDAIRDLARLCGHLPLALRIAAAHLSGLPHRRVASLVARLGSGDRLTELRVADDDQATVRTAFDQSYQLLPDEERRMFRLASLADGVDVTAEAGAALAGVPVRRTALMLDRLVAVHLLDEPVEGRYAFHDLVRIYAMDRLHHEEPATRRSAAHHALLAYYLHTAEAAARVLYPHLLRLPWRPEQPVHPAPEFTSQEQALRWLDDERANLVAVVRQAADHGPYDVAWLLSDTLRGYFFYRMSPEDLRGQFGEAADLLDRALRLCRDLGNRATRTVTMRSSAVVLRDRGRSAAAVAEDAAELSERIGGRRYTGMSLNALGTVERQLDNPASALDRSAESAGFAVGGDGPVS